MGVIFNDAMPLMAAHMVVAAYLVGGFMVASVYAVGMLRGRTDRYHRMGFIIGFTVAAIATPVQMGVGDSLARWVYEEQPTKFAAIEMVPETSSDVPEVLFGHLNSKGEVVGGIPIPGLASILSDPQEGTSTVIQGLEETPADDRPTNHEVNVTHLAWDLMVGLGTLLFLLTLWWWASWIFRRDMPRSRWFLRASATTGVFAVITLEAGWTVSEVGRQPWIVYEKMKVEDAATANTGIWVTFIGVVLLYIGLGVTTVLVLRGMSRRFRAGDRSDETDVPYGPSEQPDELEGAARMTTAAALILFAAITMYAVFGGADFGAGFWDLVAGGTKRGERPREVIDHSIAPGLGGEPRLADLRVRAAVDLLPGGVRLDHPDAVRSADPGCPGHRAPGGELRVPQGGVPHPGPAQLRCGLRPLVRAGAVLPGRGGRRHRLGAGAGRGQGG